MIERDLFNLHQKDNIFKGIVQIGTYSYIHLTYSHCTVMIIGGLTLEELHSYIYNNEYEADKNLF